MTHTLISEYYKKLLSSQTQTKDLMELQELLQSAVVNGSHEKTDHGSTDYGSELKNFNFDFVSRDLPIRRAPYHAQIIKLTYTR